MVEKALAGRLQSGGRSPAAADALPNSCPYTLDQLTADWWP
jgi:hypothetical protein